MVVWVLTAGIGIYLLAAGIAAQREVEGLRRPAGARPAGGSAGLADAGSGPAGAGSGPEDAGSGPEDAGSGPADGGAGPSPAGERADPLAPGPDGATVVGAAALASITATGGAAPGSGGPETEGSPLLEFTHPLLALTGLTFWIFFVMTDDRLFAWIAFGVVTATVLAGLTWAVLTRRATRRADREPAAFPARLVTIHGLAAACTLALVVISAVTATHG